MRFTLYSSEAGAAGNVVASRLSENPNFSVLVVEAGVTNEGVVPIAVPFLAPTNQPMTAVTWNYTTVPQSNLDGRILTYPRDFLVYTRGSNEGYDQWANLIGDDSWAWRNLEPFYLKSSRLVPPVDGRNTSGLVDPRAHGDGPIEISLIGMPTELTKLMLETSLNSTSEFPFTVDINGGNGVGIGAPQSTVGGGQRSSSATAYLEPILTRKNVDVLIQTTVTRLITTGSSEGKPVFSKVEMATNSTSKRVTVTARKEIVLSAGAIGTPQILMLSGIGDRSSLEAIGIKSRLHLPDVGQNLVDHPIIASFFNVTSNKTSDDIFRNSTLFNADLAQWTAHKDGIFANLPSSGAGFLRLPDNATIFTNFSDPTAGPKSPHFEIIFSDYFNPDGIVPRPATGSYMTISVAVLSPLSRGSVTLNSSDPFAFPNIDPNFLSSPFDQFVAVEAIKSIRRFVTAPPWTGFVSGQFGNVGSAQTDDEILAEIRQVTRTIFHPTCTARMSPKDAKWGVVDPELLVKGAVGLRVVDASVFPASP
ncbi:aryl-alcohol-oxidase from pleurotus Eryingii [Schizopora paradoxa]|uniref:Aryl-alcohol-oxidase from pleurotus Eryingii n=1 Tax=Schizopora paradoxa TaxID=27342 RepID=A0A0H2SQ28_9AGAM|nr:aryl-alcohol-oxidase from pleurotus Eryingii [Schizopora paradoxa]